MERTDLKVSEQEGRFSRWSRLKTEALENEQPQLDEPLSKFTSENLPVRPVGEELPESILEGKAEGEELDEPVDLPDIETLEKDSDYTPFLAEGVPEAIRKLALRKLWASDPVLANIDGLNDYDEDFTIIEAIKTFVAEGTEKLKDAEDKIAEVDADGDILKEAEEVSKEDAEEIETNERKLELPDRNLHSNEISLNDSTAKEPKKLV
jgi:hypothetical protein